MLFCPLETSKCPTSGCLLRALNSLFRGVTWLLFVDGPDCAARATGCGYVCQFGVQHVPCRVRHRVEALDCRPFLTRATVEFFFWQSVPATSMLEPYRLDTSGASSRRFCNPSRSSKDCVILPIVRLSGLALRYSRPPPLIERSLSEHTYAWFLAWACLRGTRDHTHVTPQNVWFSLFLD